MSQELTANEIDTVAGGADTVTTSEVLGAGAAMTGTTAAVTCAFGIAPACAVATGVTVVLAGAAAAVALIEE